MSHKEQELEQTTGNHAVSGLVGIINILQRYSDNGLQIAAGDVALMGECVGRLRAIWEKQEEAHASGR